MKIIVFGATGGTGKLLLEQALDMGHEVSAFCRSPDKLTYPHEHLNIIQGDALEADAVSLALVGQDVVLCTLGMSNIRDNSLLRTKATQNIIQAMQQQGIKRLICLSAFGAGDSLKFMPLHYRYLLVPLFMRSLYDDHNGQEQAIRDSRLDWTIIRPAILHDGKLNGRFQHSKEHLNATRLKVSRANVAAFMLQQIHDLHYLHATASISE